MLIAWSLAIALNSTPQVSVIDIEDRFILLSHLVVLDGHADVTLAELPRNSNSVEISVQQAHALIATKRPIARFQLKSENVVRLVGPPTKVIDGMCYLASQAIPKGQIVSKNDVNRAKCSDQVSSPDLSFDREAMAFFAAEPIAPGTYLGPISPTQSRVLRRNEDLLLKTGENGVSITRKVTTAQVGREGERVFVRSQDGNTFAVPVANLLQEETL